MSLGAIYELLTPKSNTASRGQAESTKLLATGCWLTVSVFWQCESSVNESQSKKYLASFPALCWEGHYANASRSLRSLLKGAQTQRSNRKWGDCFQRGCRKNKKSMSWTFVNVTPLSLACQTHRSFRKTLPPTLALIIYHHPGMHSLWQYQLSKIPTHSRCSSSTIGTESSKANPDFVAGVRTES